MRKFYTKYPNKKSLTEINEWFEFCRSQKIPYIELRPRTKYADIAWDYINLPPSFDVHLSRKEKYFQDEMARIFNKHKSEKSSYRISNNTANFYNIPAENSENFCNELFDYISTEINYHNLILSGGIAGIAGHRAVG